MLYRLALDMAAAADTTELCALAVDAVFRATPAEVAAILSLKDTRELELLVHRTRGGGPATYHKVSQFVSSEVLSGKQAVLAENVAAHRLLKDRDSIAELKVASLICAPILFEEQVLGLLHLYRTSGHAPLNADDLELTLAIARHLGTVWHRLARQATLSAENRSLRDQLRLDSDIVGESAPLRAIEAQILRVGETKATVLVRGESGSGKELVARAIHQNSPRRDGPFICLNCAALTETLLESELFGHEKGSFTGATERMIGKFEAADNGTIFLDEIGEMALSTQAKFLRVLEGHPFERVGGNVAIKVDVRVVAATNRPLEEAVRNGTFRRDLFYRLQVVQLDVPPLRDRLDDVPVLADHFLKKFVRETGRKIRGFTDRGAGEAQGAPLAGERPRAEKRDRAGGGAGRRADHRRGGHLAVGTRLRRAGGGRRGRLQAGIARRHGEAAHPGHAQAHRLEQVEGRDDPRHRALDARPEDRKVRAGEVTARGSRHVACREGRRAVPVRLAGLPTCRLQTGCPTTTPL